MKKWLPKRLINTFRTSAVKSQRPVVSVRCQFVQTNQRNTSSPVRTERRSVNSANSISWSAALRFTLSIVSNKPKITPIRHKNQFQITFTNISTKIDKKIMKLKIFPKPFKIQISVKKRITTKNYKKMSFNLMMKKRMKLYKKLCKKVLNINELL